MTGSIRRVSVAMAVAGLAVLGLVLFSATSAPTASAAKKHKKHKLRPAPPSYWGAWIGRQFTGTEAPYDMNPVSQFQGLIGKGLSLIETSVPFAHCDTTPCTPEDFPQNLFDPVRQYGAIPVLSWASQSDPATVNEPNFQLSDVINGTYDSYIANFAAQARDWGHPFFLRFDWEMNGDWFPWGEGVNGNQPGEYVAAYRHVHDIFASVGATNATWVWCPLVTGHDTLAGLRSLYPGSSYVDWTCLDGYNWGPTPVNPHPWRSFDKIFKKDYPWVVKKIARGKPMILAELGSNSAGGNKGAWIQNMFKQFRKNYRKVRAIIWFDVADRGIDWPLETNPGALSAFATGVQQPAYHANEFSGTGGGQVPLP
jgi:Glycosyl hydrolase family 26